MDQPIASVPKKIDNMKNCVTRSQSQEPLDSSSASSLSVFADHSDAHNSSQQTPDMSNESPKCEDYAERASMDEALKSEKAFIEFVMSFPSKETSEHHASVDSVSIKSKSPTQGSNTTKVGLDHLDNLCKLMEQLSELRDTNCKLQKRVQYLEDLKTIHDMHKEITESEQYCSENVISSKSGPYELQKSATETYVSKKVADHVITNRSPSKYLSRRSRNQQVGGPRRERSKSVGHEDLGEDTKSRRLFPRWSKVKEAFGWESNDRKESLKIKEERGLLGSPRRRSDESRQASRHPASPTWYQELASLHSSFEDVNDDFEDNRWKRTSVASEKYVVTLDIPSEGLRRQKSTPSPGSEKLHHSDLKIKCATIERDMCKSQDLSKFEKDDGKRGKGPWGRVKTIIEKRRDSLKRRSLRRDYSTGDIETTIKQSLPMYSDATDMKNSNEFLESSLKHPSTDESVKKKRNKPGPIVFDQEVDYVCPRTPSSSPTFHRKSTWTKMKKVLKGKKEEDRDPMSLSTPASPDSHLDGNFTFDVIDELSIDNSTEISRVGSDAHVHQLTSITPTSDIMLQLQRNLSEDFHRKIQEWEKIRATGALSCSPQWDRKTSSDIPRNRKKSDRDQSKSKIKDLAWLEKELQKIEKEKQRLSKERQKYEERALRLEKLRDTVLTANNSNKREVLVKTAAGEFRFEGISDAFTKKLYEWETKRGVGPELSTIALLDSSRLVAQPVLTQKNGHLQRVLSRSESSIADIGQPSHNSSNSLPSVKLAEGLELDRQTQPSRANSEPDLSTLVALKNGTSLTLNALENCSNSEEKNENIDSETKQDSDGTEFEKQRKNSETYYSLLEENVILLEQLKDKEEICRRLEKELEILDEKVDVMNARHVQETERYRAKLWEMHRQGVTPGDMICCRETMEQLKMRIATLERCTEKLRNDRETIEDSFRYHSREQETMTLDLLGKMRELRAVGESKNGKDSESQKSLNFESSTIDRLQGLSTLLMKQTQELEATLSEKTRQICQLKWELLHRDLSTVKLQTELHSHTAHKKRSKYANWRSRSSEEPPVSVIIQNPEPDNSLTISTDLYSAATEKDFRTAHLANTVQQLSKEVMKLTSNADCLEYDELIKPATTAKKAEPPSTRKSLDKREFKKITVRRSSADNLNLSQGHETRKSDISTSNSDDSSDEYYTQVGWRSGLKTSRPNADEERLLLPFGENLPRSYQQRKKKMQKLSKHNSNSCRKRSNTFHTNRDLVKPIVAETGQAKCQSFRITRKQIEESVKNTPIDVNLIRSLSYRLNCQNLKNNNNKNLDSNKVCLTNSNNNIGSKTLEHMLLREVASDSKIPSLLQLQYQEQNKSSDVLSNCAVRSLSDKPSNEMATLKREHIQKKRSKKRLKSPDSSKDKANVSLKTNSIKSNSSHEKSKNNHSRSTRKVTADDSQSDNPMPSTEIPTITIQLPKKKVRKYSYSVDDTSTNEEHSFTVVIPKKRSFSSEHDSSSISDNSPRIPHSTEETVKSDKATNTNFNESGKTNGNIRLLKLVSLSKFENPFDSDSNAINSGPDLGFNRKRKAEESSADHSPVIDTEKVNLCLIQGKNTKVQQSSSQDFSQRLDELVTMKHSYVKSPSAPQLEWRKVCAKKISKGGAPNVKTLIEKYNQKVIESQVYKSPHSSNVSSPVSDRKISAPIQSCCTPISQNISPFFSTPNTPIITETLNVPLSFKNSTCELSSKSPPASPLSLKRAEALRKAKENFISSQTSLSLPAKFRTDSFARSVSNNDECPRFKETLPDQSSSQHINHEEDCVSSSSMDSMSIVMLRAAENCRESRMPKRTSELPKTDAPEEEKHSLKPSKSLSSSSLFKSVLNHDFKMPSSLLRLKRSKRKKDMGTVSQLCRQSLLLTCDDSSVLPSQISHKSCPNSPELKSKSIGKTNWFQRNIFRNK